MILTGSQIKRENFILDGLHIEPWNDNQLGPNSYNLRLSNELLVYSDDVLDMKKDNPVTKLVIPDTGLLLKKGQLYLGRTVEKTYSRWYVPMLEGRSSIGRLGLLIHVSAGFGDIGFDGYWTLEIVPTKDIIIYPNVEICQIYYHSVLGKIEHTYNGKYQNNTGVQRSASWKDFEEKDNAKTCS